MEEKKIIKRDSGIVAKAGLWYTICNFFFRGMAFITTPIFARLMTKDEVGRFSNFSSWVAILLVITSLDFAQSIIRSKLEHEKDMDCYILSILSLSSIWTIILYGVFLMNPIFFSNLLKVEVQYIHIMFLHLFTAPAFQMLITKHRAFYRYKTFVLLTGVMTLSGTLLSLFLVIFMEDKLTGRIVGLYTPHILIGFCVFILIVIKGKHINIGYWKYASIICLPLVPHVLSLYLLGSSDTLIITRLCGAEYTAIYSIAYSAYHIVTILFDSMNKAWAPWLLENLHKQAYNEIKRISKLYIGLFVVLIIGVLLFVPEIIIILGGKQYYSAIYCLPPLITSCMFQFIYTMYVNVEFYEKKTIGVSAATIVATVINIVLNLIFIPLNPENSYIIAAYTTLIGYIILFILHYWIVRHMSMDHVYDIKYIIRMLFFVFVVSGSMNFIYDKIIIRYGMLTVYSAIILYFINKNRTQIIKIFREK